MLHKAISKAVLLALTTVMLLACGGDDSELDSFLDAPNLRLASLEVVEGGTLVLDDEIVEEFNPDVLGPYDVELSDQSLTNIRVQATAQDDSAKVSIIEIRRDENNENEVITHEDVNGEIVDVGVTVGSNTIRVRVTSADGNVSSDYLMHVDRLSEEAELESVFFDQPYDGDDDDSIRDQERVIMENDVFEYDVSVASAQCGLFFSTQAVNGALVYIDGELIEDNSNTYIALNEGEVYPIVIDVESFDGSKDNQYIFNVTRQEATTEQSERDARLSSVSIAQGRESTPFRCFTDNFAQAVSNEVTSIDSFAVVPQKSGTSMTLGNAVLSEQGAPVKSTLTGLWTSENDEALVSGEAYGGNLLSGLEVGDNYFVITVDSADETNTQTYLLSVRRSSTSEVVVSTAEELQVALHNAEPGDGIVILPGDYEGTVSEAGSETGSGHPQAHFYSAANGTADDPILVYAPTGGVRLLGNDEAANAVLLIEGDYWQVQTVELTGAQTGLIFDGSSNNQVVAVNVNNVGERGVVIRNGSSNINLRSMNINSTGLSPQVREGVSETYGEAVVICEGELPCDSISVRNSTFGAHVANEAIDVKSGAQGTKIQFNRFEVDNTIVRPFTDRTLIRLAGSNDEISYNDIAYNDIASGTDDFTQFIKLEGASTSVVEVFQNHISMDNQTLTVVNNTSASQLYMGENTNVDNPETALVVSGSTQTFVSPSFQIQSTLNSDQCFAQREFETEVNSSSNEPVELTLNVVAADDCADADDQIWKLVHDGDGYVQIVSAANPENKIIIEPLGRVYLGVREDNGSPLDDAFILRWRVLFNLDGEVSFTNKSDPLAYALEIESVTFQDNPSYTPIFVSSPFISEHHNFRLVEQ